MATVDFVTLIHTKTKRDYLERVIKGDKAQCAVIAKKFDKDYWDGDRRYGYGGFKYDGRWRPVAEAMAKHYGLKKGMKVLDVGCGKGFLLYDLTQAVPGLECQGIDISQYAIDHSKDEIKPFLKQGQAEKLPYKDKSFDLVISINALHNLYLHDLFTALKEIQRVSKSHGYIVVESYRNENERINLLNWQLTCECFFTPKEWEWIYAQAGYRGDRSFIYFE